MQRTIDDAEQYLERIADVTPRAVHESFTEEVRAARAAANGMAQRFMDERARDAARSVDEIEEALSDVHGEYRRLLGAAEAGRISARDYSDQFAALRRQQRALEQKADAIGRAAELVRTIEADPTAWADATFYGKYPRLQPLFSF